MIETSKLYILISVCMTLTFIQGHICMRNQTLVSIFLEISQWFCMKVSMVPQPVGLLKLILNLFCTFNINIQGKELLWHDFVQLTSSCVGTLVNWFVSNMIPVWLTLIFTRGHRVRGKLELMQSWFCKPAWSNSNVHDGWLYKGDD